MHLQIRKKEKYLLISMIWYLIIVSSALFLIFSPVQAHATVTMNASMNKPGNWTTETSNPIEQVSDICAAYGHSLRAGYEHKIFLVDATSPYSDFPERTTFYWDSAAFYMDNVSTVVWNNQSLRGSSPENGKVVGQMAYCSGSGNYDILNLYQIGNETPAYPVINEVTSFPSCLEPGTGVILESNVTGTVDDWTWEIYQGENPVWTGNSPIEAMVDLYVLSPGDYDVQLTVENAAGSDFWQQDNFLHINQSGTCNFTIYEPFPTVNVTPTIEVYPTLTLPSIIDTNMTGINTEIDDLWIIGNMSEGYREMVDYYGESVNTTFTGLVGIIVSPFTFIANAVSTGSSLFSTSIGSLMSYTTIPLAIVGITLGFYPWQIITLITAGIAVDAIFVLVFGVR